MFTKTQLFEVFVTKKLTPGLKFGLMFDEAIKDDQAQNAISSSKAHSSSPKVTIKQLSNNIFIWIQLSNFFLILF